MSVQKHTGKIKPRRREAVWLLATGLILLRLLFPGAAAEARKILITRRGAEAVEAFYRMGAAETETAEAVFGGLWNDR